MVTRDKQLQNIKLDDLIEKRRVGQALRASEFAVLAGISYSVARSWFRQPGFPAISGFVFWEDFVEWRRVKTGLQSLRVASSGGTEAQPSVAKKPSIVFTGKAAQILGEAGY